MDLKTYFGTWNGVMAENRFQRISFVAMALAILVLSIAVIAKDRTVVLVPAGLDMRGEVSNSAADQNLQASWGLFLAGLIGNVTPVTAPSIGDTVKPYLHPSIYSEVVRQLSEEGKRLEREQISLYFSPTNARWEPSIAAVVVTGELRMRGPRGNETREMRSYLMRFTVQQHRVLLSALRLVDGAWQHGMGGVE
jgi:conjugal transfer pilus assembly protein TraE